MKSKKRKLTTILAMDVVNYSAKMAIDDEGTLRQLAVCRKIIEKKVIAEEGRIFNEAGDAFMIEFSSPVQAVKASILIQKEISLINKNLSKEDGLEFRIGVNMGDVIIEGDNLFGDGVNIAARLESIAPPGRVCISGSVYSMVSGIVKQKIIKKGTQNLKNIKKPIDAYFIEIEDNSNVARNFKIKSNTTSVNKSILLALGIFSIMFLAVGSFFFLSNSENNDLATKENMLSNYNTILIVPLDDISSKESNDLFALGITQDLSSSLSMSSQGLNVVTAKKKPENIKLYLESIDASFYIEGTVRRSGDKIRVNINLKDSKNLSNIWSKTIDKDILQNDVFEIQDEIVAGILEELVGNGTILAKNFIKIAGNISSDNLTSYACINFYRIKFFQSLMPDDFQESIKCLKETVKNDENYDLAWSSLADALTFGYSFGYIKDKNVLYESLKYAEKALRINPNNAGAYASIALVHFFLRDWDSMIEAGESAFKLDPFNAQLLGSVGYLMYWGGECTEEQMKDQEGSYRTGSCIWQKGWDMLLKSNDLDKANSYAGDNNALATGYNLNNQFDKAIQVLRGHPIPGFFWYDIHSGIANYGAGNSKVAEENFNSVKKFIGSSKLEDVYKHFSFWNVHKTYWPLAEKILLEYGFN